MAFRKGSKAALFLLLAKPDKDGFSRAVKVSEFVGEFEGLRLGNGGSWCRAESGLAQVFNVERKLEKRTIVEIVLHGYQKRPINKPIPMRIRRKLESKPCVVLNTRPVEIDHKDGRRDDPRLGQPALLTVADFQPLSKAANNAKRQHCKVCRETGRRFDAKKIGYPVSQVKGNGTYRGTCVGCFWFDPLVFRSSMIKKKQL